MLTLTITRGLPASGKTSFALAAIAARKPGELIRVNRDDLRAVVAGPDYGTPQHEVEQFVTVMQDHAVGEALRRERDVIVDDCNLASKYVRRFATLARKYGAAFNVVDFLDVGVETCIERDAIRDRAVGVDVIRSMHDRYLRGRKLPLPIPEPDEAPVGGKPYAGTPDTPRTVLVDIDGTVALHEGVRSPYDATKYHLDNPNTPVVEMVAAFDALGYGIVFCSGRDADYREATLEWLREHLDFLNADIDLFMRPSGDRRNDAIVKIELFDEHIRDRFDVRFVLDDRNRVVEAWRSIGLTVLQVADGNF